MGLGSIVPWGGSGKKEKESKNTELAPVKPPTTLVVADDEEEGSTEIVVKSKTSIQKAPTNGLAQVQFKSKELVIAGKKTKTNPQQLIRCIKRITQNIGEYKGVEDVYANVVVTALRKARGDLVSILESEFHINWQINPDTGESVFYM